MLPRQALAPRTRFVLPATVFLSAILLIFSGCTPVEVPRPSAVPARPPTASTPPSATVSADSPSSAALTPTAACLERNGSVARSYITTKQLPGRLYYSLYLPPCYTRNKRYPVLYLLHGLSYQDDQWIRLGLPELMDDMILTGELPPFLVVMTYDPGWEDPDVGKYDEAIAKALVPWIDDQYSTVRDPTYRAIGGLSRGAAWAFSAGIRYPNIYSIIGLHSPVFFRQDKQNMETQLEALSKIKETRFLVDTGSQDPELNYTTRFEGLLTQFKIDHSWFVGDGTHTEAYWRQYLPVYLKEYAKHW